MRLPRTECFRVLLVMLIVFLGAILIGCGKKSGGTKPIAPVGPGIVYIQSSPYGATVSIDGAYAGHTASVMQNWSLPEGDHSVRLERLGYRDTTLTMHVTPASTDTLIIALGAKPGTPRSFGVWATLSGYPDDLTASPAAGGPIYVTTHDPNTLTIFSQSGSSLGTVSGTADYFKRPAATSSGDVYCGVRDYGGWFVRRYSSTAQYKATLAGAGAGGAFSYPPVPAIASNDTVYVLSQQLGSLVQVFRYYQNQWAGLWNADRLWLYDVAVDPVGKRVFFVGAAGSYAESLYVYTTGGQRLGGWRIHLYGEAIAAAPDGTVYVGGRDDLHAYVIRHFAHDGALLGEWGIEASVPGIAVDYAGRVYCADFGRKEIVRYTP